MAAMRCGLKSQFSAWIDIVAVKNIGFNKAAMCYGSKCFQHGWT
jgi:hypothetical protein